MMEELTLRALFPSAREHSAAYAYLSGFSYPWEALDGIAALILRLGPSLSPSEYRRVGEDVWIAHSATVAPTAEIVGPTIIGPDTEVRHCAYVRGAALVGRGCVIGNSTELKNCILFDGVQVPHYNYVGDSILGYRAHLGAGAVTSNVKSDRTDVTILYRGERIPTGRRKLGAILGDRVEVGCNSVLNPGTVVGVDSNVYPRSTVRGVVPANSIFKSQDNVVKKV